LGLAEWSLSQLPAVWHPLIPRPFFPANTRCIYYRIKETPADEANVTLCPILDFANHHWEHSHIQPVSDADIWGVRSKAKDPFQFLATEYIKEVEVDGEVCLRYGARSNQSLFVEYGFVNAVSDGDMKSGEYPAEVDVQHFVVDLFKGRGNVGTWMRAILKSEGYWGCVPRDTEHFGC